MEKSAKKITAKDLVLNVQELIKLSDGFLNIKEILLKK